MGVSTPRRRGMRALIRLAAFGTLLILLALQLGCPPGYGVAIYYLTLPPDPSNGDIYGNSNITEIDTQNNAAGGMGMDTGVTLVFDRESERLYVAGVSEDAGGTLRSVVWAYTSDFELDSTFGGGPSLIPGVALLPDLGNGASRASGIALDPDGPPHKILVAGSSVNTSGPIPHDDMVVWRLGTNGGIDTSFGTQSSGMVTYDRGMELEDFANDMIVGGGWGIFVVGASHNGTDLDMAVWRIGRTDLEATFGTQGVLFDDNAGGGAGDDIGYSLEEDWAGRIVVCGTSGNPEGGTDMAVWRLNPISGNLDGTFYDSGSLVHSDEMDNDWEIVGKGVAYDYDPETRSGRADYLVCGYVHPKSNLDKPNDPPPPKELVVLRVPATPYSTVSNLKFSRASMTSDPLIATDIETDPMGGFLVTAAVEKTNGNVDIMVLQVTGLNDDFSLLDEFGVEDGEDYASRIGRDSDDDLYIVGWSLTGPADYDMKLWRVR